MSLFHILFRGPIFVFFASTWSLIPSKKTDSDLWNQYFLSTIFKYQVLHHPKLLQTPCNHFIPEDHTPFNGPAEDMDFKSCRRRCDVFFLLVGAQLVHRTVKSGYSGAYLLVVLVKALMRNLDTSFTTYNGI